MNPLKWAGSLKVIVLLSLALAASVGGNFLLVRKAWIDYGEAKVQGQLDAANSQLAGYKQTEAVNVAIAGRKALDTSELLSSLSAIAERGQQTRVVYGRAAAAKPLPSTCAPGQARIDAVNAGLGPIKDAK